MAEAPEAPAYMEHQKRQLCGLHAVNNLLQRKAFRKRDFDTIASELFDFGPEKGMRWSNPHKRRWVGQYDANVLIRALDMQGFEVVWHNRDRPIDELAARLQTPAAFGLIVNLRSTFCSFSNGRHWISVRRFVAGWFLLDSKSDEPVLFGSLNHLVHQIADWLEDGAEVLLVETPQTPH